MDFSFKVKCDEVKACRDAIGSPRLRYARAHQNSNNSDVKDIQSI